GVCAPLLFRDTACRIVRAEEPPARLDGFQVGDGGVAGRRGADREARLCAYFRRSPFSRGHGCQKEIPRPDPFGNPEQYRPRDVDLDERECVPPPEACTGSFRPPALQTV